MIIAKEKRKQNIAEYILYMWQVEDIIRALNGATNNIKNYVQQQYNVDEQTKAQICNWYITLSHEMQAEGIMQAGHLNRIRELLLCLKNFHQKVLQQPSQALYNSVYHQTLPTIIQLRSKSGDTVKDEIETCFTGIYGYLTLKLQGKEVSSETEKAIKQISTFLAMLADRFREYEEGRLSLTTN